MGQGGMGRFRKQPACALLRIDTGRKQLRAEREEFDRMIMAIQKVLQVT